MWIDHLYRMFAYLWQMLIHYDMPRIGLLELRRLTHLLLQLDHLLLLDKYVAQAVFKGISNQCVSVVRAQLRRRDSNKDLNSHKTKW